MEITLAGRYQIVKHLGGGGFGQTFLAQDNHLPGNPLCVVKQLQPKVNASETLEIAKRLFNREAETLYRLGHHDRIPHLLAHFEQADEFYLVQEYVEGKTLDQELVPGRRLSETAGIELLRDILEVMVFVHKQQVIHRDIKPANLIRRNRDGRIVLIDFGAVKEVSNQAANMAGHTSITVAIGSPGYMPTEQQAFKPHFSSDIYAIGMVCIQALTGLLPKQLPRDATTGEIQCRLFDIQPPISPGFGEILETMVRYDYRQRYKDAIAALEAFQDFLVSGRASEIEESTVLSSRQVLEPTTNLREDLVEHVQSEPVTQVCVLPDSVKKALEQLLASYIGPIAAVMLGRAIAESDSHEGLVDRLTKYLPEQNQKVFRERAIALLRESSSANSVSTVAQTSTSVPVTTVTQVSTVAPEPSIDPSFVKRCEVELATVIGPIAPLLVKRTLSQQPNLSQRQLIEVLSQHLPNADKVEAFRRSLLAP